MIEFDGVSLETVQTVYSGPERLLWELLMGEQIHIGGMQSSLALARASGVVSGTRGIDLCCCTGAGMRFLLRCLRVGHMTGVDATPAVVEIGRARCESAGVRDCVTFVLSDASSTGLEAASADFVWGEDAWCYVEDKEKLIYEAVRLVRPGGIVAFTDWITGPTPITDDEARRLLQFMKFPNMLSLLEYRTLFESAGATVLRAEDTGRFGPAMDLYLRAVSEQLAFDVLRILNFDQESFDAMAGEMAFLRELARDGKIIQGMFVAQTTAA